MPYLSLSVWPGWPSVLWAPSSQVSELFPCPDNLYIDAFGCSPLYFPTSFYLLVSPSLILLSTDSLYAVNHNAVCMQYISYCQTVCVDIFYPNI